MNPRVRRARLRDGRLTSTPMWETYDSNGDWSGTHDTWREAIAWATTVCPRLEHWLAHQAVRP